MKGADDAVHLDEEEVILDRLPNAEESMRHVHQCLVEVVHVQNLVIVLEDSADLLVALPLENVVELRNDQFLHPVVGIHVVLDRVVEDVVVPIIVEDESALFLDFVSAEPGEIGVNKQHGGCDRQVLSRYAVFVNKITDFIVVFDYFAVEFGPAARDCVQVEQVVLVGQLEGGEGDAAIELPRLVIAAERP